jgi:hypothetical protein
LAVRFVAVDETLAAAVGAAVTDNVQAGDTDTIGARIGDSLGEARHDLRPFDKYSVRSSPTQ